MPPAQGTRFAQRALLGNMLLRGVGVVVGSLLLTPLVGIAVWFGWREDRPKAAAQALWTSLAIGGLVALAWVTEQVAEYLS